MDDDYGFYTAARREDMIMADVEEAMEQDWRHYSPPANFRQSECCEHCVYLRRLKDIRAKACVRKGGPIFLDFLAVGHYTLDQTTEKTCDKWEDIFG